MAYVVHPAGFARQEVVVEPTSFLRGPRLLVDGQPATRGRRRGEMLVTRDDGRQVVATWKLQALGFDVPSLVVDGKPIQIVTPLPWYVWIWCALPLILVLAGGFGAFLGLMAFWISARLFRANLARPVRYLVTGGMTALAVVACLLPEIVG